MSQTEVPAHTDLEVFQAALELAAHNQCDPPENAVLLRALKVYRLLEETPHDLPIEVFVSEDGTFEISVARGDTYATVMVESDRLEFILQERQSGKLIDSSRDPSDEQLKGWFERAA